MSDDLMLHHFITNDAPHESFSCLSAHRSLAGGRKRLERARVALRLYALSVTLSWPLVVLDVRLGRNGGRRFKTAVSIATTLIR